MLFSSCRAKPLNLSTELTAAIIARNNTKVLQLLDRSPPLNVPSSVRTDYSRAMVAMIEPGLAWGQLPLIHLAAMIPGNNKVLLSLLDKGADVSVVYETKSIKESGTILHNALAVHQDVQIISTLLSKGLDINAANCKGITPIQVAINSRKNDAEDNSSKVNVLKLLISNGAKLTAEDMKKMVKTTDDRPGEYELLKTCHDKKMDLTPVAGSGILHHFARKNTNCNVAQLIKDFGLAFDDFDKPDSTGRTPLSLAAEFSKYNTAFLASLLNNKFQIDSRDDFDLTPLMYAVANGNLEAARLLVQHGADLHAVTMDNKTLADSLIACRKNCNPEVANSMSEYINVSLALKATRTTKLSFA